MASAAALAAFEAPLAIGTDTGGSIRQPAAVTGTVGTKPTYGGVSRYGVIALASSLDQVGPCARTVTDTALLHEVIAGHDPRDSTSIPQPVPRVLDAVRLGQRDGVAGHADRRGEAVARRGLPGRACWNRFDAAVATLQAAGAEIVEVDCPHFQYALAAYYLILPSECSSNLARFDAMRYGLRVGDDGNASAEEVMSLTRGAGVRRRGEAPHHSRHLRAVRRVLRRLLRFGAEGPHADQAGLRERLRAADVLISPSSPVTAFAIGEKVDDPMAMYLNDLATIPGSLAGIPAMSVPSGIASDTGLPVGLQIMGPALGEERIYRVAAAFESAYAAAHSGLVPDSAPELEVSVR